MIAKLFKKKGAEETLSETAAPQKAAETSPQKRINVFRMMIVALVVVLPLLYVPFGFVTLPTGKLYLLYIVAAVLSVGLLARAWKQKSFYVPKGFLGYSIVAIPLVYLAAGIFSKHFSISFFGRDFTHDSVIAIISLFALTAVVAVLFKNTFKAMYVYAALLISAGIAGLVHLLNIVVPAMPSLGIFGSPIATTIGKWNDLGLFALVAVVVSFLTLESIQLGKKARWFVYVVMVLNMALMILVDFALAWWLLGITALLYGVTKWFVSRKESKTVVSKCAISLFVIAVLFLAVGPWFSGYISSFFNIVHVEARPSVDATVQVAQGALDGARIIIGSGPALFETEWPLYRPNIVLETGFWNTDFRYGFGLLPTFVITTGLLGGITWVLFLIALIISSIKVCRTKIEDTRDRYLVVSSGTVLGMLLLGMLLYLPSATLVVLAFVFLGLYLAALQKLGLFATKQIGTTVGVVQNIIRVVTLLLIIIAVAGFLKMTQKFVAHVYFQTALAELVQTNRAAPVEPKVVQAARLDGIDTYFRSIGEIGTAQAQEMIVDVNNGAEPQPDEFRQAVNKVVGSYQQAIAYDPQNYNNYTGLASFYTVLVSIGVKDAYSAAKGLYQRSLELKPNNPATYLAIANLELVNDNVAAARSAIDQALEIKPNYSQATFFLAQLEVSQGRVQQAVRALENAATRSPNDPNVYFQLGLLYYDTERYQDSVLALERTVSLNPALQNARYFLGLAYYQTDEIDSALRQFELLLQLNTGNEELRTIVTNLRAGNAPFSGLTTQAPTSIEDIDELPLEDGEETTTDDTTSTDGADDTQSEE